MKKYLQILPFLFLFSVAGNVLAQKILSSEQVVSNAAKEAKSKNKKILLMFHASWCSWCKKMDNALQDATCKDFFSKNYEIVHLTVMESKDKKALENPGADAMMEKYGGKDQGLPYWVILDAKEVLLEDGKLNKTNIGCPASPQEVEAFITKIKNTSKPTAEEEEKIKVRFLKNK